MAWKAFGAKYLLVEYALAFIVIFSVVFFIFLYFQMEGDEPTKISKKTASLSVIIPAFNEEEGIGQTIRSVASSDYPGGLEVIVVDDGSADSTFKNAKAAALGSRVPVHVFRVPNGGKSKALNFGIAKAKGELVATLDADCTVGEDSLAKLASMFPDPAVMACTAAVKVNPSSGLLSKMQEIEYLFFLFNRSLLASIDGVYVTPGPLSVFRKKVFSEVGGFAEGNVMEDQEIALRIQSHHYRILSSFDAVVYTKPPQTISGLIRQRVRWNRGGLRNLKEYAFLVHPNYGDLGVLVLPLWFLSVVAVLAVFGLVVNGVLSGQFAQFLKYGFLLPLVYGVDPVFILSILSLALGVFWLALGWWYFRDEKVGAFDLALYFFIYPLLSAVFWVVTFVKELKAEPLKW